MDPSLRWGDARLRPASEESDTWPTTDARVTRSTPAAIATQHTRPAQLRHASEGWHPCQNTTSPANTNHARNMDPSLRRGDARLLPPSEEFDV